MSYQSATSWAFLLTMSPSSCPVGRHRANATHRMAAAKRNTSAVWRRSSLARLCSRQLRCQRIWPIYRAACLNRTTRRREVTRFHWRALEIGRLTLKLRPQGTRNRLLRRHGVIETSCFKDKKPPSMVRKAWQRSMTFKSITSTIIGLIQVQRTRHVDCLQEASHKWATLAP